MRYRKVKEPTVRELAHRDKLRVMAAAIEVAQSELGWTKPADLAAWALGALERNGYVVRKRQTTEGGL